MLQLIRSDPILSKLSAAVSSSGQSWLLRSLKHPSVDDLIQLATHEGGYWLLCIDIYTCEL